MHIFLDENSYLTQSNNVKYLTCVVALRVVLVRPTQLTLMAVSTAHVPALLLQLTLSELYLHNCQTYLANFVIAIIGGISLVNI